MPIPVTCETPERAGKRPSRRTTPNRSPAMAKEELTEIFVAERQQSRQLARPEASIVARDLFLPLVRFLRLDRHGRDRPCDQPLDPDRIAGDFAIAIIALVDTAQGGIDLGNQLALAIASSEFVRSEEHTSELQSLMRLSYAVFSSKKKNTKHQLTTTHQKSKN